MYYKEFLRVRHMVVCVAIVFGVFTTLHLAFHLIYNLAQHGDTLRINVGITDQQRAPLSIFFAIAGVVASIVAGILAVSLGSENNGHLEQAWTKPVSRSRYALTLFAVDLSGVIATFLLTLGASLLNGTHVGGVLPVTVDADAWPNLLRFLLLPMAWFGLIVGLTASLRASCRTVAGLSWVGAFILFGLGFAPLPAMWAALVKGLNYLNPIAYASYTVPAQPPYPFQAWEANLVGLIGICIFGVIAALLQWRRLEA